ncbi:hypothetical protein OB2597_01642 [Pseudooceanicola batsensis HTCC2597]|uniref:BON domain-containing protein n=2 Tax=Pseudooceanicola batsensis TaxID=314255 RepID=A3TWS2_PSEBH|nr:hypothetical protein OB2597_01642 [Pseudooceanicola batsensis HTCC2597]
MTEEEAREEMARRHRESGRSPYTRGGRRSWMDQMAYGQAPMFGSYGWPFMPPAYPEEAYGAYAGPFPAGHPREQMAFRNDPGSRGRDFFDKAGDEVASWFGDDAAEARREADHRGRGPKGYIRSDARIEEDIHDRLTDDPYIDAREISVSVKDREITLDGTVDSRRAKRHAEDCADSVSGVTHVQNNLRVQPAA